MTDVKREFVLCARLDSVVVNVSHRDCIYDGVQGTAEARSQAQLDKFKAYIV